MGPETIHWVLIITLITICSSQDPLEKLAKQQIESYQPCMSDIHCKSNSFCYGNDDNKRGFCKCLSGFQLNRNVTFYECVAPVRLGEPCEKNFECQVLAGPLAICNKLNLCDCNPEIAHRYKDDMCYKDSRLNETCLTDANCLLLDGTFGFCTFGHCQCNVGFKPDVNKTSCIFDKNVGDKCFKDSECDSLSNARCSSFGKCECRRDYVVSRDGKTCLRAALQPDDPCVEDLQCSLFLGNETTRCTRLNDTYSACTCVEGFHGFNSKCIRIAKAGEQCSADANCVYDKKLQNAVKCSEGYCLCTFGSSNSECNLDSSSSNFTSSWIFSFSIFVATQFT